jgi:hypothetical protein
MSQPKPKRKSTSPARNKEISRAQDVDLSRNRGGGTLSPQIPGQSGYHDLGRASCGVFGSLGSSSAIKNLFEPLNHGPMYWKITLSSLAAARLRYAPDRFLLTNANTSCTMLPASLRYENCSLPPGMPFAFPSESALTFVGILNLLQHHFLVVRCVRSAETSPAVGVTGRGPFLRPDETSAVNSKQNL